jgi:hypothetical protein
VGLGGGISLSIPIDFTLDVIFDSIVTARSNFNSQLLALNPPNIVINSVNPASFSVSVLNGGNANLNWQLVQSNTVMMELGPKFTAIVSGGAGGGFTWQSPTINVTTGPVKVYEANIPGSGSLSIPIYVQPPQMLIVPRSFSPSIETISAEFILTDEANRIVDGATVRVTTGGVNYAAQGVGGGAYVANLPAVSLGESVLVTASKAGFVEAQYTLKTSNMVFKQYQALSSENSRLQENVRSLEIDVKMLSDQVASKGSEITNLRSTLEKNQDEIVGLQKQLEVANDNIRQLQAEAIPRQGSNESLVSQLKVALERLDTLNKDYASKLTEIQKLQGLLVEKEGELNSIRTVLEQGQTRKQEIVKDLERGQTSQVEIPYQAYVGVFLVPIAGAAIVLYFTRKR